MGIMNVIPGWKYISAGVGIGVLIFVGYLAVKHFFIGPQDLHAAERKALEVATAEVIDKLRAHLRSTDRRYMTIAVPDVRNDTSNGELTFYLRQQIGDDEEHFKVASDGILKDVKSDLKEWVIGSSAPPTPEAILETRGELDGVLLVTLDHRKPGAKAAQVDLSAQLLERTFDKEFKPIGFQDISFTASGIVSFDTLETLNQGESESASSGGGWDSFWWSTWRMLVCILGAAVIPFVFLPATDAITKKNNNVLGMAYLAFIVFMSMLPWLMLFIFDPMGGHPTAWLFGIALGVACFFWTYTMHDEWSERI